MLQKKIVTIDRDTGQRISAENHDEPIRMSEQRYYKPFIDLYKEVIDDLITKEVNTCQ